MHAYNYSAIFYAVQTKCPILPEHNTPEEALGEAVCLLTNTHTCSYSIAMHAHSACSNKICSMLHYYDTPLQVLYGIAIRHECIIPYGTCKGVLQ